MDQQWIHNNGYASNGETVLIAAVVTVFLFVVLLAGFHLYTRWCLRRGAAVRRTHVLVFSDNQHPGSSADSGLEAAVLNSLPVFRYSSKAATQRLLECAVCLSDFEENEVVRLLPKCSHAFHTECIDMWFYSHSTCPICRSPVEPAANRIEPSPAAVVAAEEVSERESVSSSESKMCARFQHTGGSGDASGSDAASFSRQTIHVKIEPVVPSKHAELESGSTQISPVGRLLSFKRLLSMGKKPAVGSGISPRHAAGPSCAAELDLDLERGLSGPIPKFTHQTE
ncbi:hypothetical protein OROGR_015589 [Orobanche gracilis]